MLPHLGPYLAVPITTTMLPSAPLTTSNGLTELLGLDGTDDGTEAGHVECYSPTSLIAAVDFHQSMFPSLEREVIADVLQHHTPQAGLEQLLMLSACVEEAERGPGYVPDEAAWDASAWDSASSTTSGDEALALALHHEAPASSSPPAASSGTDDLTAEDKLAVLQAEFEALSVQEISSVLLACDNKLSAAVDVLRSFAQECAGAQQEPAVALTQQDPAIRAIAPLVQQLAVRFPALPEDSLQVALQLAGNSLSEACRILSEQQGGGPPPQPMGPTSFSFPEPPPLGPAEPAPLALAGPMPLALGPPPPLAPPLPSEHGQALGGAGEERRQENMLREAYKKCFELATAAYQRGDKAQATMLSAEGSRLRQKYQDERVAATTRISRRVNEGNLAFFKIDLHCMRVDEALELVDKHLHTFPHTIPGGAIVRYITGKGLHSGPDGPRIRPAVMELLASRGVPFVEGGGWLEATIGRPAQ
eukprot:scaffold2.g6800.t1